MRNVNLRIGSFVKFDLGFFYDLFIMYDAKFINETKVVAMVESYSSRREDHYEVVVMGILPRTKKKEIHQMVLHKIMRQSFSLPEHKLEVVSDAEMDATFTDSEGT